jgi:hypothetical protein
MRRTILAVTLFVFAAFLTSSSANAQQTSAATASVSSATSGHGRGVGLGAATMLNGASGAMFTWGSWGGGFHVDGLFGLHHYRDGENTTSFGFAGRFWYHVHAAAFADLSLGGGLGITSWTENPGGPGEDSHLDLSLQVGAQIRAFIVPNVALIGDLGLGATFGGHSVAGAGEPEGPPANQFLLGTLGIAYFFE